MGGSLMQSGGGGRGGRTRMRPMAEINVTPLVDVMLVLLIVFMVTAPLLTVAVPLDLPKADAKPISQSTSKEPLVVSIDPKGHIYIQETKTGLDDLVSKLSAITNNDPDARIYVRGDEGIDYGRVMEVMGAISAAGFTKIALVAELPPAQKSSKKR